MEIQNKYNVGSMFAYYASITACLGLAKQTYHQFIPEEIRAYIDEKLKEWFSKQKILDPKVFTLVINQYDDGEDEGYRSLNNNLYNASETYLSNKLRSLSTRLKGYRGGEGPVLYQLAQGEEYTEYVTLDEDNTDVRFHWRFVCKDDKDKESETGPNKSFELSFDPRYKDAVLDHYIPSVVVKNYDIMKAMKKEIYLHSYNSLSSRDWNRVKFNHPFTFDSLALDPELKKSIVDDIDRFLKRREFYKKIGRAWKRGYLLYGPPGTGKSSLIAAIANYLKFNIYDLQLGSIQQDTTLRNLMLSIGNKSILVIEDIDCASGLAKNNVALSRGRQLQDSDSDSDSDMYGSSDSDDYYGCPRRPSPRPYRRPSPSPVRWRNHSRSPSRSPSYYSRSPSRSRSPIHRRRGPSPSPIPTSPGPSRSRWARRSRSRRLSPSPLRSRSREHSRSCSGSDSDSDNEGNNNVVNKSKDGTKVSLSGLLNFIDGLWSSCGDERIIILTTNYKDRLDPALLRPGRMDMHIHMSYLKMPAFRVLASNYLDLTDHPLFEEIEELLNITDVSPAEVAEELIRSEDPDVALKGVVNMMKKKKKKNKRVREKASKGKEVMCDEPLAKKQKYDSDTDY